MCSTFADISIENKYLFDKSLNYNFKYLFCNFKELFWKSNIEYICNYCKRLSCGNKGGTSYAQIVDNILENFEKVGANMSEKLYNFDYLLDKFFSNLVGISYEKESFFFP